MADLSTGLARRAANDGAPIELALPTPAGEPEPLALVELLFFAYRDFTSDPDAILAEYEFGRAHHRVLHFVEHYPGLRVADLLDILKITKQSLARVLRQLVAKGFIEQRLGKADRRERRLYTTAGGRDLARRLLEPQVARMRRALGAARHGADGRLAEAFLSSMMDPEERTRVVALLAEARRGRASLTEVKR